ncbi:MAG: hypothetical protein AMJ78_00660 [Omnitrophica WOR_2 bacterium SM23_29]|nr:MAG: hypothetical protein AMJ78_00660 [Omnitrophica WOR_2 bacterium SM23_29]
MFEQFSNYPEITWTAATAARFIKAGDKFQVNPDLENFKLVRFKDLRKQPKVNKESHLKLMLIGSSNTNVFIYGPDSQIDEIVKRLPKYIGKSWTEINSMSLERDSLNCENFEKAVCNPELLNIFEFEPIKSGEEVPELDFKKADEICAKCEHFDPK